MCEENDETILATYTRQDYLDLAIALKNSQLISNGRPDMFQYHQNQLTQAVAEFLLKPYVRAFDDKSS